MSEPPPKRKIHPHRPPLHLVAADTFLLILFAAQVWLAICLLIYGAVPLPQLLSQTVLKRLLPEELKAETERVHIGLDGQVELRDSKLFLVGIEQPVIEAEEIVGELAIARLLRGDASGLKRMTVTNGTLFQPARFSPSGERTPTAQRVTFTMVPDGDDWLVESLIAQHQEIRLRGSVRWPIQMDKVDTDVTAPDIEAAFARMFTSIGELLTHSGQLAALKEPTLTIAVEGSSSGAVTLRMFIGSPEASLGAITLRQVGVGGIVHIEKEAIRISGLARLRADTIDLKDYDIRIERLDTAIEPQGLQDLLAGERTTFEFSAANITAMGYNLRAPTLKIDFSRFPELRFSGSMDGLKNAFTFSGNTDLSKQTLDAELVGAVDLLSLLPDSIEPKLPVILFRSFPFVRARAVLAEGFKPETIQLLLETGPMALDDVFINNARATAVYENGFIDVRKLRIDRHAQWLEGTAGYDLNSGAYAANVRGEILPQDYNNLLPPFWENIFRDLTMTKMSRGYGDFAVHGRLNAASPELIWGRVDVENIRYSDVPIDSGSLIVRARGAFVELHQLSAVSGGGFVNGDIGMTFSEQADRGILSLRPNGDARLPPDAYAKLLGPEAGKLIDSFDLSGMLETQFNGALFFPGTHAYTDASSIDLELAQLGSGRFLNSPFKNAQLSLAYRNEAVFLRDITVDFADGILVGDVDINNLDDRPQLCFDASLNGALAGAAMALLESEDASSGTHALRQDASAPEDPLWDARLDLTASGCLTDFAIETLSSRGRFTLVDDNIGSISILGPLSRLLKNTPLGVGFTSFELQNMSADFRIQEGVVSTDNLLLSGPESRIESKGTIQLADGLIRFNARINLIGNMGNRENLLRKATELLNPLPVLLNVDLGGTIENPEWRLAYDPRKFINKIPGIPQL